jgi:hypothetical protein
MGAAAQDHLPHGNSSKRCAHASNACLATSCHLTSDRRRTAARSAGRRRRRRGARGRRGRRRGGRHAWRRARRHGRRRRRARLRRRARPGRRVRRALGRWPAGRRAAVRGAARSRRRRARGRRGRRRGGRCARRGARRHGRYRRRARRRQRIRPGRAGPEAGAAGMSCTVLWRVASLSVRVCVALHGDVRHSVPGLAGVTSVRFNLGISRAAGGPPLAFLFVFVFRFLSCGGLALPLQ